MSRREFFLGAVAKAEAGSAGDTGESPEVAIGRIGNFPVGERKLFLELGIIVESLPEGLRAQAAAHAGRFYSIKTNLIGELVVNRAIQWPANRVFSILTNESAFFDTSGEN